MIYSAPVCTTCLVIVSKIWLVFADVLFQVLTSKKVDYIFFANQSCLSKLYFELWGYKESNKENCGGNL